MQEKPGKMVGDNVGISGRYSEKLQKVSVIFQGFERLKNFEISFAEFYDRNTRLSVYWKRSKTSVDIGGNNRCVILC